MLKFADLIIENAEEIAALDSMDAGKLFAAGKNTDIPSAAQFMRYYAGAADKIHGTTLKMSRDIQGYTLLEPIGVVGHIIPWNFPTQMFVMKVGPALAAGCTMVVKPAEQTPLSALYYAQLAKQVNFPFFICIVKLLCPIRHDRLLRCSSPVVGTTQAGLGRVIAHPRIKGYLQGRM